MVFDIYSHTLDIILRASRLGGYQALPAKDVFDMEYWVLEQAKLRDDGVDDVLLVGGSTLLPGFFPYFEQRFGLKIVDFLEPKPGLPPTPADVDVMGHWHQHHSARQYWVNGSLIGYSPLSIAYKTDYEPPSQGFFIVHPTRGKTLECPVYVDE